MTVIVIMTLIVYYGSVIVACHIICMFVGSDQGSVASSPLVSSTDSTTDSSDLCLVAYTEPEAWCTVHYYELNTRVCLSLSLSPIFNI